MLAAMTTVSGSASACSRAARFGVSPTTACSCAAPCADQIADHDQAGGDADPHLQRRRRPASSFATASIKRQPGPHRALGVVLMRLRIAEIGEHAVAHVLGDEPAERAATISATAAVIGADDLAQILGIEPGRERGRADEIAEHDRELAALGRVPERSVLCIRVSTQGGNPSIAMRRCPTMTTPRSFKSSAVKLGRTLSSIAFSRNDASYCSRPRLRSQTPRSMMVPQAGRHDLPSGRACLGGYHGMLPQPK